MQTPYSLERLRLFRRHGQVPSLPVFITCSAQLAANMDGVGAMAIYVKPSDSEIDWQALAGVDVVLDMPDSDTWTPLMLAIRSAQPRRLRVFAEGRLGTFWRGHA